MATGGKEQREDVGQGVADGGRKVGQPGKERREGVAGVCGAKNGGGRPNADPLAQVRRRGDRARSGGRA